MAYRLLTAVAFVCLTGWSSIDTAEAQVHVDGYFRQNGTYVAPYTRGYPDGNPYNNRSWR